MDVNLPLAPLTACLCRCFILCSRGRMPGLAYICRSIKTWPVTAGINLCLISCRFLVGFSEVFGPKTGEFCRCRTFFEGGCIESLQEILSVLCRSLSDARQISCCRQNLTSIPYKLGEKSLKTDMTLCHILQSLQKFREKPLKSTE